GGGLTAVTGEIPMPIDSEAVTTDGDASPAVGTPWPRGTEGTLAGRVSGRAERGNPVEVRVRPGKPTVREAQFLCGGNGWSRSECRQAERPQETGAPGLPPSAAASHNWPDTGICPARKGADVDQVGH